MRASDGLLPISAVELVQIAGDALFDLRQAPLHLRARKVLVTVVHRLELAAIDRDARFREQAHGATVRNKPVADLPDSVAVVLAGIGNRFEIGKKRPVSHITSTCARPHARAGGSTDRLR